MKNLRRRYIDARASAVCRLALDSRAIAALEYALIASMIAVGVAVAATSFDFDFGSLKAALNTSVSQIREAVRP